MTPAPTNEMAIGRKISDLAMFSPLARSASTATARPSAVDSNVTVMTHHRLLMIEPRRVPRMMHARKKKPASSEIDEPGVDSYALRTLRPLTTPMVTPMAMKTMAIQNSRLPTMLENTQFDLSKNVSDV